jgi:hypothetical protein
MSDVVPDCRLCEHAKEIVEGKSVVCVSGGHANHVDWKAAVGIEKWPCHSYRARVEPSCCGRCEEKATTLPTSSAARKNVPMVRGCLDYFPAALAAVAEVSRVGNEQHNPGEEMHHARGKSTDHADCIVRHLMDRGSLDGDGQRHMAKVAWRALALLQEELEAAGAPLARGARVDNAGEG